MSVPEQEPVAQAGSAPVKSLGPAFRLKGSLSPWDIQFYRAIDVLSGIIICAMLVFSPWAFGTTQAWSIWTMNIAGYSLGLLLLIKFCIRFWKGYIPSRWPTGRKDAPTLLAQIRGFCSSSNPEDRNSIFTPQALTFGLWISTLAILAYTLVSALNARATYDPVAASFDYHDHIPWLPHSLDSALTWSALWQYIGFACSFWAMRDWLLGKTGTEERVARQTGPRIGRGPAFPARLRMLLWVLAINGALLGIEGIIQRVEGSGQLLFLVKPRVNPDAITQFGPYAYRSNASQYFNLVWPAVLGFWWTLQRSRGGGWRHHALLVCAAVMAACPIISTSRGGAFVTVGIAIVGALFLLAAQFLFPRGATEHEKSRRLTRFGVLGFLTLALGLGFALGWSSLKPRLPEMSESYDMREEMYARALPMATDYPWFGTGPGTFKTVFQLYRFSNETYWPAQLHNDWLETRITFGNIGITFIGLALLLVLLRWFARGGIHGGRRFIVLTWLALLGCFVHARWDLPFQIHSIVFVFIVICAVLSTLSRRASA